ncbi:hypothetical protein [Nitrococcus mobilis]|uniref:Uncharacterized protein n=1 Tax=Nitrococcus mobilis Nb-231 TaxID=314278 RepID=A4BLR1_9GAMM|nr:hypothetical protein [Nitrococcus mobilis]EAR23249.1 hypothetical protein NB231_15553 [Nitrococcus mobilis Nb-231]
MSIEITLNEAERAELQRSIRPGSTLHKKQVQRAQRVLLRAEALLSSAILRRVGVSDPTLARVVYSGRHRGLCRD